MSKKTSEPINRQALEEASQWFVDFRVEEVDPAGRERFDAWLRRSPEHIRAYLDIAETYAALPPEEGQVAFDLAALVADAQAEANVVALGPTQERTVRPRKDSTPQLPSRVPLAFAASAAAAIVSIGAAAWLMTHRGTVYATAIGEQRSLALSDGSTVNLNARSRIRVRFTEHSREVELVEGQALFQVAGDTQRGFIVSSGDAQVRALGTQFDVNRKESGTTVTVLEGRVAVSAPRPTGAMFSSLVTPGQQVTLSPRVVPHARTANVGAVTAWTQRRLVFNGSRLDDVVDEFNRFNSRQLTVDSSALVGMRISGVYSSTDPASLLRFLREQPGIVIAETRDAVHIKAP